MTALGITRTEPLAGDGFRDIISVGSQDTNPDSNSIGSMNIFADD